MHNTIANHLQNTLSQISVAAKQANRDPADIQLLAVSKTKPVSDLVLAYQAGQRHFGENYVQEGVDKVLALAHLNDLTWHFIGPIQSNKSKFIAQHFAWCHSIDRLKIAQRLNNQRPQDLAPLNVCIQINIDNEPTKAGIMPEALLETAAAIAELPNLRLRGIMAIPQATPDVAQQTATFLHLQRLFNQLTERYCDVDTLSMGMSGDLAPAIAAGSTMVRVGTGIFGARNT